jgi:hypothetical protein
MVELEDGGTIAVERGLHGLLSTMEDGEEINYFSHLNHLLTLNIFFSCSRLTLIFPNTENHPLHVGVNRRGAAVPN